MPPTLLLIRHAQALHNISNDWEIADPPLSDLGIAQCAELQSSLASHPLSSRITHIITSPMRRTLQTTTLGLRFLIEKGVPVTPSALWQENSDKPCDMGSSLSIMAAEFPGIELSSVDPSYPDKTTGGRANVYAFSQKAVLGRAQRALREVWSMEGQDVVAVVSHSGFLRAAVTGGRQFANADWRIFEFEEGSGGGGGGSGVDEVGGGGGLLLLKESRETEEKGGGMGNSQKELLGIREGEFPPEEEEEVSQALGEGVDEKPSSRCV